MDTLVRLVRRSLCNAFRDELGTHLLVKTTAVMGPNVEVGDVQEAIHLNRLYLPGAEGGERRELETLDTWKSWCHRWDWQRKAKL